LLIYKKMIFVFSVLRALDIPNLKRLLDQAEAAGLVPFEKEPAQEMESAGLEL